jgi:hypothetical protein
MIQKIIVCSEDGKPLQTSLAMTAEQAAAIDRSADLLMAYQWGREAVRDSGQESAFAAQFGNDTEAHQHFDAGMASIRR